MSRSEFDIIRTHLAASAAAFTTDQVVLGIGDDAAQLRMPGSQGSKSSEGNQKETLLNVSLDVLVAGVHFPHDADAAKVANRALAVNLSDLAAMGATPLGFTLGLTIPDNDEQWLCEFGAGLAPLATRFACPLLGGDLSRGPLNIAIQVHGYTRGEGIRRAGAQPGDQILVSGSLGKGVTALANLGLPTHLDAMLQFDCTGLGQEARDFLMRAYYEPHPRIELGQAALGIATAGIDISDGLLADLGHICKASQMGARIELARLPVAPAVRAALTSGKDFHAALLGGDDYELCLTAPARDCAELIRLAKSLDVELTVIGEIEAGAAVRCLDHSGTEVQIPASAYQHFVGVTSGN